MNHVASRLAVVAVLLSTPSPAPAAEIEALIGQAVVTVEVFNDGLVTDERAIFDLLETRTGQPLSLRQVRESVTHLFTWGDFADVQVSATEVARGVALRYDLVPLRGAAQIEIRGTPGRPPEELLGPLTRRFGRVIRADQFPEAVALLEALYVEAGRFAAGIRPEMVDGRLLFEIDQGPAALIGQIQLRGVSEEDRPGVLARLGVATGVTYDPARVVTRLEEYEADIREERYYEASFRHDVSPAPDGSTVDLVFDIRIGLPVEVVFEGDAVPDARLDELVPVAREGSIDEDLLEDSSLRIETHLRGLGYRDARVIHRRLADEGMLTIVFTVDHGSQYRVEDVVFAGQTTEPGVELVTLFGVATGMPLVMTELDEGTAAVRALYASRGYRAVQVTPVLAVGEAPILVDLPQFVPVEITVEVVEGPRTTIGLVAFDGNTAFSGEALAALIETKIGDAYFTPRLDADRDRLRSHYRNEGYETVQIVAQRRFDEDGANAQVTFQVDEGVQVVVDHILVVGTNRIAPSTVRSETTLRPGAPLGLDEIAETRRRLTAMGLFRRIEIRGFSHGGGHQRDVVIFVEEAPASTVGYGGGIELGHRLRATAAGVATEQFELAPRGFLEIGRRNLWGKNRSLNLFTRVSVRRKDDAQAETLRSRLGFNEYRVLLNYREPRAFGRAGDLLVSGFVEQAIRPSFDLFSRGVNAELRRTIGFTMTGSVGYTYGRNRVSNQQFEPEEGPLVDRLFPEVTLSSFSSGVLRDTRNDALEPTSGGLLGVDGEVALRAIGSEVGFAKTTLQGYFYRQLPGELVFAGGARLGVARGFTRSVSLSSIQSGELGAGGGRRADPTAAPPVMLQGLPASERFFAGGDTTVRGFALDQLGDDSTIDAHGFPTGGNAMVVMNAELRVPVTGAIQAVGFLDAGNVFDRVGHLSLGRIRGAAGFGLRYRSPVGPLRFDAGFKLDRQEFAGERESLFALHFSIGQAF